MKGVYNDWLSFAKDCDYRFVCNCPKCHDTVHCGHKNAMMGECSEDAIEYCPLWPKFKPAKEPHERDA